MCIYRGGGGKGGEKRGGFGGGGGGGGGWGVTRRGCHRRVYTTPRRHLRDICMPRRPCIYRPLLDNDIRVCSGTLLLLLLDLAF